MPTKTYTVTKLVAFSGMFQNPPTTLSVNIQELDDASNVIKSAGFIYTLSTDEQTNLEILLENAITAYQSENGFA